MADRDGIAQLALDKWSFNAEAQAFFAKLGFSPYNVHLWKQR